MGERGGAADVAFLRETELALINAPFAPDGWQTAIGMIASATWSRGANLVCLGGSAPSLNLLHGCDHAQAERILSDPAMWGPQNWRVGSAGGPFEIQHDMHYRAYREGRPRGDYDEAAYELDMPHGCQTIFSRDVAGFIGLAIIRGQREGAMDPDSVARFEYLTYAMGRALRLEMALAGDGIHLALGQFDRVRDAVILVNRHGWACGMSRAAERMIDRGTPILQRGAQIGLAHPIDDHRFQQLLAFMLHRDPQCGHAVTLPIGAWGGGRWTLTLAHLPPVGIALGFEPQLSIIIRPTARTALSRVSERGSDGS